MDKFSEQIAGLLEEMKEPTTRAALEAARMEAYSALVMNLFSLAVGVGITALGV